MPPRGRSTSSRSATTGAGADTAATDATAVPPDGEVGRGFRLPLPDLTSLPGLGKVDAKRLLWMGGLGALATVGILEWPVAVVIGAGSVVAERLARENNAAQR